MSKSLLFISFILSFIMTMGQSTYYKSKLQIDVVGNGFADKTEIYFCDSNWVHYYVCTDFWDDLADAQKIKSDNGQPTIYTKIDGYLGWDGMGRVGINGRKAYRSDTVSIPLGVLPGRDGNFKLIFNDTLFDEYIKILIKDIKLDSIQNIRLDSVYNFDEVVNSSTERFIVYIIFQQISTSIDVVYNNFSIIFINNSIFISNVSPKYRVRIINLYGQILHNSIGETSYEYTLPPGFYFVEYRGTVRKVLTN